VFTVKELRIIKVNRRYLERTGLMTWKIGRGKADITADVKNISMLGYGNPHNTVKEVETPLNARTLYFKNNNNDRFILINLEICFVTESVRKSVYDKLTNLDELKDLREAELMITAQHTHAAPGGYTHYPLYNMPTPGYVPEVLEKIVTGSVESVVQAIENLTDATIEYVKGEFDAEAPVAFNRSVPSYMKNPEVWEEGLPTEKNLAMDRNMRLLRFKSGDKLLASANWFGCHTTNIPNTNHKVSPDNKGYASLYVEEEYQENDKNFIALFNQGSAADITPNFILDPKTKMARGQFEDPFESARFNGKLQANQALKLMDKKEEVTTLTEDFDCGMVFVDMADVTPDEEFIPKGMDGKDAKTTHACHGVAFIQGTEEGPGVPKSLGFFVKLLSSGVKLIDTIKSYQLPDEERRKIWTFYKNQAPKDIFVEAGNKRVLGIRDISKLPVPDFIDPLVATMKKFYGQGSMREHTWIQEVMPVQIVRIGQIIFLAMPNEVTTISALRFRRQVLAQFKDQGVEEVILASYSNGFSGYITTPQEYEVQHYEAGHTVFGKWTHPAYQTIIKRLCTEMLKPKEQRDFSWSTHVPEFSQHELEGRTYGPSANGQGRNNSLHGLPS
jgi:neutral ceramidase